MREKPERTVKNAHLISKVVGALPLLNGVLDRLQIEPLLGQFVSSADRRLKLAPAVGLGVVLRNILLAREPLYGLTDWVQRGRASLSIEVRSKNARFEPTKPSKYGIVCDSRACSTKRS